MDKEALKPVSLLLIEDDDIDAMTIKRGLDKYRIKIKITRAYDGLDALEKIKNNELDSPFIILLDLQMPRMNGLEFLNTIRNDDQLNDLVIFVLTTSRDESDIAACYREHIAGYFVKDDVGKDFFEMVDMLGCYWKIVHMPARDK